MSAATREKISATRKARGLAPSPEAREKGRRNTGAREAHPAWKGGRAILNGYSSVYVPDHPNAYSNGHVYEHRLLAEDMLGRPLRKGEIVHHDDDDKANNQRENLRVLGSQAEHMRLHQQKRRAREAAA